MHRFVTATDTGAGKTYVAARWLAALRRAGRDAVGFKPICCGDRADAEILHRAAGTSHTLDEINPVWFKTPAAPLLAARAARAAIDPARLVAAFAALAERHEAVIVEGVGGWLAPLRPDYFVADLAADLQLPVTVVARNVLGAVNHTLLTLESIAARRLICAELILNNTAPADPADVARATNRALLAELAAVPPPLEISFGQAAIPPPGAANGAGPY